MPQNKNVAVLDDADDSHDQQERPVSAGLESILGKRFGVLDDGFVRVADYMGSDLAVVQAARVSYGMGTKIVRDDRALIRYLMRHRHTTPFEMCEIKLHVRVPMDTWRQWIRHRTANVNEYSTRYSVAIDSAQRTAPSAWRRQAKTNRQGSDGVLPFDAGTLLSDREAELHKVARDVYEQRLDQGVSREQARKDLPLSTYTEAYWKIDLHNLLHFLALRMDAHAQWEISQYATVIGEQIVSRWVPMTWEAFRDYRLDAVTFSGPERDILRLTIVGDIDALAQLLSDLKWTDRDDSGRLRPNRERTEFADKYMTLFGAMPAWLV
jgi:thymidylate synthase (FAD)